MSRGDPERVPDLAAVSGRDSADPVSSLNSGQAVRLQIIKEEKMIRHIFIGAFKEGISAEVREQEVRDMRAMKERIPGIVDLQVGMSTGWAGPENQVVMTVDFATRADFDVYMAHPYHRDYINWTGTAYFDRATFVSAQFEF